MKKHAVLTVIAFFGFLSVMFSLSAQDARAAQAPFEAPQVFQAAGPDEVALTATLNAFRAAIGGALNDNNPGPIAIGRREIAWGAAVGPVTPFNEFLTSRGAQFSTPRGDGLAQGTAAELAALLGNNNYTGFLVPFSAPNMFAPVGGNVTETVFFVPGAADEASATPAAVRAFGVVFIDVDQPEGSGPGRQANRRASTLMEAFDANNARLFSGFAPASPGDGNLSFLGIIFDDPVIARVRITTGPARTGQDESSRVDIVVMDDFIYGEPQALPAPAAPGPQTN
jgi:hypothetical protein